jgi:hypothetical protein
VIHTRSVDQTRPLFRPRFNIRASSIAPFYTFRLFHSSWQELQQVNPSPFLRLGLNVGCNFPETKAKTATRRAIAKPKDGEHSIHIHIYMRIYSMPFFLSAGKTKRAPSAYNLFVKEHMKTYLADHPGKTNKDAMKHVRLVYSFNPSITDEIPRSAHFGKMHPRIPSVVRRRPPKVQNGRRRPPQVFPRALRSNLVATSKRVVNFFFISKFDRSYPFERLNT